jgi:O-acetyl-ADP-ribose deacetylase (regulator of RNase III)
MNVIRGDLLQLALEGQFDVIVHGCNCHCAMGAGIAKSIKTLFPEAYLADQKTTKGDRSKLGLLSYATVCRNDLEFTVVNAYTQFGWRGKGVLVDYDAVRSVMRNVKLRFTGLRIGYPRIGAGLAGGDWTAIASIIDEELVGENHLLVEYVA